MRRELDEKKLRVLGDLTASRHIRLSRHVSATSQPDPVRREFRDIEFPGGFKLTTGEKQAFTANLTDWIQTRRKLLEDDHEAMNMAIIKAFPIDKYFAAESNAGSLAVQPEN